ncbi:MAG: hypothetical protein R3C99_00350 [Pirellulaceae bacterium]|nr:hypothetical protein [Planctomycetales bacterium]
MINERTNRAWFGRGRLVGLVLATSGLLIFAGCGYPKVSPAAFELSKAVDNLCNLRSSEQIAKARQLVREKSGSGEITDSEEQILTNILDMAEAGQWERAEQETRELLSDQTRW